MGGIDKILVAIVVIVEWLIKNKKGGEFSHATGKEARESAHR
jgi:hypothetical protein